MTFVVDASVAIKWVLREPGSPEALALAAESLVAPPLLRAECANALWAHARRGEITEADAQAKLVDLLHGGVEYRDASAEEALRLAVRLDHPVYDCVYLALAQAQDILMVTADSKFAGKVERAGFGAHLRRLESWR